jgi:3-methyl-2-oxobutanoate hydroxymethyltransferase
MYDLLGIFEKFTPKFVKKYANLSQDILQALEKYKEEVEQGIYPGPEHSYHMQDEVLKQVTKD